MNTKSTNNIPSSFVSRKAAAKITKQLLMYEEGTPEYLAAFERAQQWRAQHALPTENCFRTLIETTRGFSDAVLTFRLKRMKSILSKIRRENKSYQLGTMDDIGGCRLILDDMQQVEDAIRLLSQRYELKGGNHIKNYINNPRLSGYRSCHLITVNPGERRGYRVEIQIRTKLQHLWSTAVEATGLIHESDYKTEKELECVDVQERDIREFFAIVSSLFALEEGTALVERYRKPQEELLQDLHGLTHLDDIIQDLSKANDGVFLSESDRRLHDPGFYLMRFATDLQFLDISHYSPNHLEQALSAYDECECSNVNNDENVSFINYDDVVLAYAQDNYQLELAFPNYSARVGEFLEHILPYI